MFDGSRLGLVIFWPAKHLDDERLVAIRRYWAYISAQKCYNMNNLYIVFRRVPDDGLGLLEACLLVLATSGPGFGCASSFNVFQLKSCRVLDSG